VRAIAEVNAAIVALLAAALYDPVWRSGGRGPAEVAIAVISLMLLGGWRVSALLVVAWSVAAAIGTAFL
jgi:chromate transporter